ncbi:DUF305 domain-containing protein [Streptomyces sp. NRRL WC-3626]|uniref:DUF305 domain-containing protein n=1 Tax=Streptomyces sp. NRRL WC-3626 TaxID=1463926 RepID=UPI0004C251DD|nr:DUF305 domain-containing protein [Streptomyces sp. NRRL WC-3626]
MRDVTASRRPSALGAVLLVCALAVPGCAGSSPGPSRPIPASAAASHGGLTTTDIGWTQLLIAMDDQARYVLRLAPRRSGSRGLKDWASGTADHHRAELVALRALLSDAGLPDDNPHKGHDMPGMVNAEELRALEAARGPRFDRLLRSALVEHFTQAGKLAAAVRTADTGARVKRAAAANGSYARDALRRLRSV